MDVGPPAGTRAERFMTIRLEGVFVTILKKIQGNLVKKERFQSS